MRENQTIAILVDVDMDGYTSAALLINYLEMQRKDFGSWPDSTATIVPIFHDAKIHGLNDQAVMRRLRDTIKPDLLIIPDASGNSEQYQALVSLGIDIVVLDHHDVPERGDGEKVIVVNNQQSKNYVNKALSGVGVVWQTCREMDNQLPFICADMYLDLVALGLVADVMDMRSDETRFLIFEGLKPENMHCPICQMAPELFKDYDHMDPHFVAWSIAPIFNAVNRIGTAAERDLVFGSFLDENLDKMVTDGKRKATGQTQYVREAWRQATNAQSRQNRRRDKLTNMIDELIRDEALADHKVIVLAIDDYEQEYKALSGLVANKIAEMYQRPCVIAFQNEEGDYAGSLRAPDGVEAWANFRDLCSKSGFCKYATGHAQAAGIYIYGDAVMDFIQYFDEKFADVDTETHYTVDFVFDAATDCEKISQLCYDLDDVGNIWGQGIKEPLIAIKNIKVGAGTLELVGKMPTRKTLKFKLDDNVVCVKFKSSNEEFQSLCLPYTDPPQYYNVNVVGTPSVNRWGAYENPQIVVTDYEVTGVAYDF